MNVKYISNNSGGDWWLKDEDWYNLEKSGWNVHWFKNETNQYMSADKDGRWLRALAKYAEKEFDSPSDAMKEFEKITSQKVSDEGCNCCGAPHSFEWEGGYASGEDCLEHLFGKDIPKTFREALEKLK